MNELEDEDLATRFLNGSAGGSSLEVEMAMEANAPMTGSAAGLDPQSWINLPTLLRDPAFLGLSPQGRAQTLEKSIQQNRNRLLKGGYVEDEEEVAAMNEAEAEFRYSVVVRGFLNIPTHHRSAADDRFLEIAPEFETAEPGNSDGIDPVQKALEIAPPALRSTVEVPARIGSLKQGSIEIDPTESSLDTGEPLPATGKGIREGLERARSRQKLVAIALNEVGRNGLSRENLQQVREAYNNYIDSLVELEENKASYTEGIRGYLFPLRAEVNEEISDLDYMSALDRSLGTGRVRQLFNQADRTRLAATRAAQRAENVETGLEFAEVALSTAEMGLAPGVGIIRAGLKQGGKAAAKQTLRATGETGANLLVDEAQSQLAAFALNHTLQRLDLDPEKYGHVGDGLEILMGIAPLGRRRGRKDGPSAPEAKSGGEGPAASIPGRGESGPERQGHVTAAASALPKKPGDKAHEVPEPALATAGGASGRNGHVTASAGNSDGGPSGEAADRAEPERVITERNGVSGASSSGERDVKQTQVQGNEQQQSPVEPESLPPEAVRLNPDLETRRSVDDKLARYLLNPAHPTGGPKAKWFRRALGFTQSNADELAVQFRFNTQTAVKTAPTPHGIKYNQIIGVVGANGRRISLKVAWIRNNDGVIRLVTAVPND